MRRVAGVWVFLLSLAALGAEARAEVDLDAHSAVLERLQATLPRLGLGELHIGGGAALSLAMTARHGSELGWRDIDVRAFPKRGLDTALMDRVARELTRGGWAEVLAPGLIEFTVHHTRDVEALHHQGFGLRMRTATGLRFDLAALRSRAEIARSGYNSAESLVVPLHGGHDLRAVLGRLREGTADEVVARGDLVEVHGHAADVLGGKVVLTNRHVLKVEPELAAIRYLRGTEKLARQGLHAQGGARDLAYLKRNLPRLVARAPEVKDPSYAPRVQEQAAALLETGGPALHREARAMGLDLPALSRGEITRPRAAPARGPRR